MEADGQVHLQGIGKVDAVKASKLKIGDHLLYNYGGTGTIINIRPKGKNTVELAIESRGNLYYREKRLDTLVATDAVMGADAYFAASNPIRKGDVQSIIPKKK
ncbi:MAG: hypothetical protein IJR41_04800 [Atopobiaceae bacterium]|nr:hypothetical protein [Atopobiaceae bacterium]